MQTLSHGIKKPQTGDVGQPLFDDLALNFQIQNDHSHNGTDSVKLPASSLLKLTQPVPAANWATPINGIYSQSITITGGLLLDETTVSFRDASGNLLILGFDKVTPSIYKVYCNDPTLEVTAVYA